MKKMIVMFGNGRNYLRDYCEDDAEVFISEGIAVLIFDSDISDPEDFVGDFKEV